MSDDRQGDLIRLSKTKQSGCLTVLGFAWQLQGTPTPSTCVCQPRMPLHPLTERALIFDIPLQ